MRMWAYSNGACALWIKPLLFSLAMDFLYAFHARLRMLFSTWAASPLTVLFSFLYLFALIRGTGGFLSTPSVRIFVLIPHFSSSFQMLCLTNFKHMWIYTYNAQQFNRRTWYLTHFHLQGWLPQKSVNFIMQVFLQLCDLVCNSLR